MQLRMVSLLQMSCNKKMRNISLEIYRRIVPLMQSENLTPLELHIYQQLRNMLFNVFDHKHTENLKLFSHFNAMLF